MTKSTVLLVDDHTLVRAGIRSLIEKFPDFMVVGEASNPDEALISVDAIRPEVIVTDITMGNQSGLDLIRIIKQRHAGLPIVVLSMHSSEELVKETLRLGASAYLLKEAAPEELAIALRAAIRGESYLSPAVSTKMIKLLIDPNVFESNALSSLTVRQIQILKLIAHRKSVKEIAFALDLSEKTVSGHRAQIMERINIRDNIGLSQFAAEHGLMDVSSAKKKPIQI